MAEVVRASECDWAEPTPGLTGTGRIAEVTTKPKRHTGGRPTQAEALRRDERLVEIAARMFMERGFDATTIDAVAEAASVGKATVYARYNDKADLFAAVLKRQVDRWLDLSGASVPAEGGSIEEVLLALARQKVAIALTPEVIAINRIVSAQAGRFPDLAKFVYQEGAQRSTAQVAELLRGFVQTGEIETSDIEITAELFSSLIIGRQTRLALLGIQIDPEPLERRLRAAVALFLNGARPRKT